MLQLYVSNYYNQMSHSEKQEHSKKKKEVRKQQQSEEEEEDEELDDDYEGSFIAEDEDISNDYVVPYIAEDSADNHKNKKSKKDKKKDKKHKKEKRRRREEEEGSFDEDDLDVIDNQGRELTRLKKKKEPVRNSSEEDEREEYDNIEDQEIDGRQDIQSDQDGYGHAEPQSDQLSPMVQVAANNMDIFDPADMKILAIEDDDKEIVDTDLPQRYMVQLRNFAKHIKKVPLQVRKCLEEQDRMQEAQWAYNKLRQLNFLESYDEKESKERIKRVLETIHREHLDIMYIYYYRKKIFSDYLTLDILWKIQEFDEEWYIFSEKQNKSSQFLEVFLPSYIQVPRELLDSLQQCTDLKYLKYFEDYEHFAYAKWAPRNEDGVDRKKYDKYNFISQMAESRVAEEIQTSEIFLTPHNLVHNLRMRAQEKKPRTPNTEPKEEFQRIMKANDSDKVKGKYPLLALDIRFKTISKYLCYELFAYPQLRKLLREKYYKKLVISTAPTIKGNQDVDLYSVYFPIKRIKDKPITTLKREMWILALQAEKKDLVKIELKFQWELSSSEKNERQNRERDSVYIQIARHYYDISNHRYAEIWNLFRKRVVNCMLSDYFFPSFMRQIKDDLTREGQRQIISACCQKLKHQLNKGPSLKEGKPIRILSMVLEDTKLGIAFVDQSGKPLFTFQTIVCNDDDLRKFVSDQNLTIYIKEHKPDMILIAANCKRAQTLRKELRNPDLNTQSIFCAFGQYQIPRLVAKKKIIMGFAEEQSILEAISMARLKKNPMAEIISLWSDKMLENGILSLNLHQYQSFVNQQKLRDCLERVIIEMVNLVGLDLNQISKNDHIQNQLQFVSGLGPRKAFVFLEKMKEQNTEILNRRAIEQIVKGKIVAKNCSPFLKIQTSFHRSLFEKIEKGAKTAVKQYEEINMLDMTRIPPQWYTIINIRLSECYKPTTVAQIRSKKHVSKLSEENIILVEIFKNSEKIRGIDWRSKDTYSFDEDLVKSETICRFRNPRENEKVMDNRQIFFNLLRETPQTLKRYMIMPVKILSLKKNYLNVIIPENGLFGYIKIQSNKSPEELEKIYEKGTTVKAVIIGFPFDERMYREQSSNEEQQLLKIEMSLDFPHKDNDRHEGSRHDCMNLCFPSIVKEIHPLIDLEKDRFELKREDKPQIEVREQKIMPKNIKADFRRISHPKFKNISAIPAIELMKSQQIGEFVIRPSSQGPEYLTITWNFFKGVIVHIKVRCEHKGMNSMNITYRIEDKENRSYNSLEQIIEKCIKPMNSLVQDVASNKKFANQPLEQIESQVKRDMLADSSHIYYYFGVSEEFPQYFLLIYMYKEKKPLRELIKVKSSGLYFHDQQFSNIRDLIAWFKEHLKEKEYQKYVKNTMAMFKK